MYCGLKWSGVDGGGVVVIHCARSCYTSVRTTSTAEEDEEKVECGADEGVGKHKEVNRFPNDNNNKSTLDRHLNYTVIAL